MPADPKPEKRVKDKKLMADLHSQGLQCCLCAKGPAELHHVIRRSQGGDDVYENLLALCSRHHQELHAGDLDTRNDIGSWLLDERPDVIAYVHAKLGATAGADWLRRKLLIP